MKSIPGATALCGRRSSSATEPLLRPLGGQPGLQNYIRYTGTPGIFSRVRNTKW